jgi:hydrogenase maturation protease
MTGGRPRILVAGVGNVFLGDDGFGPAVVARLAVGQLPPGVRALDYGIRGVHLSYDLLDGWDELVLIDTLPDDGTPGEVRVLAVCGSDVAAAPAAVDAHGLSPAAVLGSLRALGGRLPRTVVVGCVPGTLAEGMGLSPPVAAAVERAAERVRALLRSSSVPAGS